MKLDSIMAAVQNANRCHCSVNNQISIYAIGYVTNLTNTEPVNVWTLLNGVTFVFNVHKVSLFVLYVKCIKSLNYRWGVYIPRQHRMPAHHPDLPTRFVFPLKLLQYLSSSLGQHYDEGECVDLLCEDTCNQFCIDHPTSYSECKCISTGSGQKCFTCPKGFIDYWILFILSNI